MKEGKNRRRLSRARRVASRRRKAACDVAPFLPSLARGSVLATTQNFPWGISDSFVRISLLGSCKDQLAGRNF